MRFLILFLSSLLFTLSVTARADDWAVAEENGKQSQRMVEFCTAYVRGWLRHADPKSGLLPRTVRQGGERYWNAKDCAADNLPFLALTAEVTDDYYARRAARHMLAQEQHLCNRLGPLPDDFDFTTQSFREREINSGRLIFGASEYCKDGLMPISEWIGPSPWLDRMQELIHGIWERAAVETPVGMIPSTNIEVNGDLMETLSRLYWLTGDESYKRWCFRLMDYYFLHEPLLNQDRLPLRDHGCEIIAGLSEAYLIAAREDRDRWMKYKPQMHALLDTILERGANKDGLMYDWVNLKSGETSDRLSDSWGYVYNAFLTVGQADGEDRYRQVVQHALTNLHKYRGHPWEGRSVDGYADSIEGAVNLLNRVSVESAFEWVDSEIQFILNSQRHDGIVEGWHGDGNSARTMLMVALWKTQGVTLSPWREDLQLGAVRGDNGSISISLKTELPWVGFLRFDRPRHRQYFHMPIDYARINQFPEWFTVELGETYEVRSPGGEATLVEGKKLLNYPVTLDTNGSLQLSIEPTGGRLRAMQYSRRPAAEAIDWQKKVRRRLFDALAMSNQLDAKVPLDVELVAETQEDGYLRKDLRINSTRDRRIDVVLTVPSAGKGPFPSVVCIHGHGGNRFIVYDAKSIYRGFAESLARRGAITIAVDVGQHELKEQGRTLIGERLWDLMRCVDYLESMPEADSGRIGCAGLSLGGEMAMWLGAMDERIVATVSSGFLTTMDQLEINHCMCWKFPGLREVVDWADVYSLTAPRALLCQNGLKEPLTDFNVSLARQAFGEIGLIYGDCGNPENIRFCVHNAGHAIDLESLLVFLQKHLGIQE